VRSQTPDRVIRRPTSVLYIIAVMVMAGAAFAVQSLLDEETEQLLVDAVTAATELDLYNARCRSDGSGRRTDNLNKELASKFRMTVLKVQDDLFPDGSYRRAQQRLQQEFLAKLKDAGGCREAKQAGMPKQLRARYEELMRAIDRLP